MIGLTQDMDAESLRETGERVHALYSRAPFGRVLKTEIDGILFRAYARHQHRLKQPTGDLLWCHYDPQGWSGNTRNWTPIQEVRPNLP